DRRGRPDHVGRGPPDPGLPRAPGRPGRAHPRAQGAVAVLVLGIETSCDETGVALVEDGRRVRSNVLADQQTLHARYGGVVPEVASRAHVDLLHPAVEQACALGGARLGDVDAVAVTIGPGLAGSLLVGVAAAKAYALALDRPLVGVNHLIAHVYANVLDHGALPLPARPTTRWPGCSASATRAARWWIAWPATATRPRCGSPGPCWTTAPTTSPSPASRRPCCATSARPGPRSTWPTWPRRSKRRWSTCRSAR